MNKNYHKINSCPSAIFDDEKLLCHVHKEKVG